ncbi:MAG TPA: amino acid ABC transporter permease, partial [Chloroflexi bacterium]|nr:amino acid ABC transporter permease [Chloroflexota bacterium]
MATQAELADTPPPVDSEAPPIVRIGVLGWLRENLFSSVPNTILTLISGYFVFVVLRMLIKFIFFE